MNPKKNSINRLVDYFCPEGKGMALTALLLSVFSVFTLLIALCPAWYEVLPTYSELITGVTTFSGYNKEADMRIVRIVLLAIPVFFFGFCGLIRFLCEEVRMERQALEVLACAYILWLVSIINKQGSPLFLGVLFLLFVVCYSILKLKREVSLEQIRELGLTWFLTYVATESLGGVFFYFFGKSSGISNEWTYNIPWVLACVWTIINAVRIRTSINSLDRQIGFWQILIPIGLIPMAMFQYTYELTGETFLLFYSSKYKYCVYGMTLLFVFYGTYAFWKKKKGIYITTVIATALLRTFTRPEGVLNIDFFHMGEMSTPFMQFDEYGKIPFFDLMPIHGLCDYYYSAVNYFFLDNTYLSMNAAMTIGNLILAAFLSVVIYLLCNRKEGAYLLVYCFVPFMVNDAGIRYIFFFVSFLVLFSSKIRDKALRYIWWYVVLAILSITWNMSIGGAEAAAFFPVALFWYLPKAFYELKDLFTQKQGKKLGLFLISYVFLLVLGICYIPLFLQIVSYLKENTGTTLMANGMAMIEEFDFYKEYLTPSIYSGEQISFLKVFGFLVPFLGCLILAFKKGNRQLRRDGREYGVIYFVCFYIIANYAFVRFDSGLRTGVLSVFFLVAFLIGVQKWKREEFWILTCLAVFMTGSTMEIEVGTLADIGFVNSSVTTTIQGQEVQDPLVYVTGESVGMERLGTGFIRGNTLQNLKNLKYVLDEETLENRKYFDLTNGVANYVFLNGEMVLPYTSGYNISNEEMQKYAIAQLEANPVDLVILAPYIRFDEATISLRSPLLFEYLYDAGYKPYVYENVIYMKKSGSSLFKESNGFTDFANLMHKESLQMLPAVWGNSEAIHSLSERNVPTKLVSGENKVTWHLLEEISGMDIDFVKITIPESGNEDVDGMNEIVQKELHFLFGEEDKEFAFYREGNNFLIPVYSSPFWKKLEHIDGFSIKVDEGDEDALYWIKNATISFLNF